MKNDIKTVRDILPDKMVTLFDDITQQRVLGASKHIAMIGDMIEAIALAGKEEKEDLTVIIDNIKMLAKFFIETRGEASQAISNAIRIMIHEIDQYIAFDIDDCIEKILQTKNNYLKTSEEAIEKVVEYATVLAKDMSKIFVFDYSSTVDKFLTNLESNEREYTIYIAESRIIDGGLPFVLSCQKAGHKIKFIPDASIMYYLQECDGAFMGAETFFPDGTGFNTTGSDIVGLVCFNYNIPLYFLTPMIKIDIRPIYGYSKVLVINDMKQKFTKGWDQEIDVDAIDFRTPELLGVEPKHIKGFVTEKGIIPANQMYEISLEYSKYLRGDAL